METTLLYRWWGESLTWPFLFLQAMRYTVIIRDAVSQANLQGILMARNTFNSQLIDRKVHCEQNQHFWWTHSLMSTHLKYKNTKLYDHSRQRQQLRAGTVLIILMFVLCCCYSRFWIGTCNLEIWNMQFRSVVRDKKKKKQRLNYPDSFHTGSCFP